MYIILKRFHFFLFFLRILGRDLFEEFGAIGKKVMLASDTIAADVVKLKMRYEM